MRTVAAPIALRVAWLLTSKRGACDPLAREAGTRPPAELCWLLGGVHAFNNRRAARLRLRTASEPVKRLAGMQRSSEPVAQGAPSSVRMSAARRVPRAEEASGESAQSNSDWTTPPRATLEGTGSPAAREQSMWPVLPASEHLLWPSVVIDAKSGAKLRPASDVPKLYLLLAAFLVLAGVACAATHALMPDSFFVMRTALAPAIVQWIDASDVGHLSGPHAAELEENRHSALWLSKVAFSAGAATWVAQIMVVISVWNGWADLSAHARGR